MLVLFPSKIVSFVSHW